MRLRNERIGPFPLLGWGNAFLDPRHSLGLGKIAMEHDSEIDLAMACLRMAQAKLRIERERFLALELLYAGTGSARAEALQRHMERTLDESKNTLRDLLVKQRLSLERRFASVGKNVAWQPTGTLERP